MSNQLRVLSMRKPAFVVEPIVVTFFVPEFISDADLKSMAMNEADETPARLFGSKVNRFGEGVVEVLLYRD